MSNRLSLRSVALFVLFIAGQQGQVYPHCQPFKFYCRSSDTVGDELENPS